MDKAVNTSLQPFQDNITLGLLTAYKEAFSKFQNLLTIQNSRRSVLTTLKFDPNQLQIKLLSSLPNGKTNADRTKNQIDLRYNLIDGMSSQPISADLAADTINLLSDQELARILGYDVVQQGYVEAQPRTSGNDSSDQRLWIIAAVLGPLVVLFAVFWVIFLIYYKCINTQKRRRMTSKSKSQIIGTESPDSVNIYLLFKCIITCILI